MELKKPFAIVWSPYHGQIAQGLLAGAKEVLQEKGLPLRDQDLIQAPGAFEMPLIAKTLAKTGRYSGVICLGCVIKGDTAHFEFISLGATIGIQQASLETGVPIAFGILTTYDDEQALKRTQPGLENKGREAALAAFESARILSKISS